MSASWSTVYSLTFTEDTLLIVWQDKGDTSPVGSSPIINHELGRVMRRRAGTRVLSFNNVHTGRRSPLAQSLSRHHWKLLEALLNDENCRVAQRSSRSWQRDFRVTKTLLSNGVHQRRNFIMTEVRIKIARVQERGEFLSIFSLIFTFCAGMTFATQNWEFFLLQNCSIFSVLCIFKYNPAK